MCTTYSRKTRKRIILSQAPNVIMLTGKSPVNGRAGTKNQKEKEKDLNQRADLLSCPAPPCATLRQPPPQHGQRLCVLTARFPKFPHLVIPLQHGHSARVTFG